MNPLIHLRRATSLFLVVLGFIWLGLLPTALAVSPAPDGGYPGGNTAEGQAALLSLTTGGFNTAVGFLSLRSNATGPFNTAIGAGTLLANTANENTATGAGALLSSTTGAQNTANGAFALFSNTTGSLNTATGFEALFSNTTGNNNTAIGYQALLNNSTGSGNTAIGDSALISNTTGGSNTANGANVLHFNTTGGTNTATGLNALESNTIGNDNTASGTNALRFNTIGTGNTAIGHDALLSNTTGGSNTAIAGDALGSNTTGEFNIGIGIGSGTLVTTANSVICIQAPGANVSNTCFIGNIRGVTTINNDAIPVLIDSAGQLGTISSSARFKKEIKLMDSASEAILALKPVTFHYKSDKTNKPEFGLIAEQVAEVNPDLVVRDKDGQIYTVRYDAVNAMLLNEFLKEHRKVEKLEATLARQQRDFEAALADLKGQIQKVSAQVELSKPAPQTVLNNQ